MPYSPARKPRAEWVFSSRVTTDSWGAIFAPLSAPTWEHFIGWFWALGERDTMSWLFTAKSASADLRLPARACDTSDVAIRSSRPSRRQNYRLTHPGFADKWLGPLTSCFFRPFSGLENVITALDSTYPAKGTSLRMHGHHGTGSRANLALRSFIRETVS